MKKVTYTITAKRVFVLTKSENDEGSAGSSHIADFPGFENALQAGKALQLATPNSELVSDFDGGHLFTKEGRQFILDEAISAATKAASSGSLLPEQAAKGVVNAAFDAAQVIARRVSA